MFKTLALSLAALALSAGVQAAPALVLQTTSVSVHEGDTFEVLLRGKDFDHDHNGVKVNSITGGQGFKLAFSSGLLQLVSVGIDSRWSFKPDPGVIDNKAGTLTGLRFGNFPATEDDDFNIATLTLKALGAGDATLAVTAGTMAGTLAAIAGSTPGKSVVPTFGALNLQILPVSQVPEPQHWAMLLAGLGVLGLRLRRA